MLYLCKRPKLAKFAQNAWKVPFRGSRWCHATKMVEILGNFFTKWSPGCYNQSPSWIFGGNFHVIVELKAKIIKNLLKMLEKCCFGGSKWRHRARLVEIFGKKIFQYNLLSIMNYLHYCFMANIPCQRVQSLENCRKWGFPYYISFVIPI